MITLILALTVAAVIWRWSARRRRGSAIRAAERDLPRLASDLARSVRAGATLGTALSEVGHRLPGALGGELQTVIGHIDRGDTVDRALHRWRIDTTVTGVDLLVGACRFGVDHGGDLGRSLDGVAASLLDRLEVEDETRALAAQARTSAAVLVLLPPVGAAVFAVADPSVAAVLLGSTAGWVCVAAGTALDALGAWISARLVRTALS